MTTVYVGNLTLEVIDIGLLLIYNIKYTQYCFQTSLANVIF
jgi:hypothetical protein